MSEVLHSPGPDLGVPHAIAHASSFGLTEVLALLHAAKNEVDEGCDTIPDEAGDLTDARSRALLLIGLAESKVRGIFGALEPFV